jgi:hypothetical protein
MTTMKTAVEFYREEYKALVILRKSKFKTEQEIFEQAKEIEKEQIIKAYNESFYLRDKPYATAEKYYNETYNK